MEGKEEGEPCGLRRMLMPAGVRPWELRAGRGLPGKGTNESHVRGRRQRESKTMPFVRDDTDVQSEGRRIEEDLRQGQK